MTLLQRLTAVIQAIGLDIKSLYTRVINVEDNYIEKTEDGRYPALDGSNITNLVLQITELEADPNIQDLTDGKVWLLRTQAVGGIIQPHGLTPMFTNKVDRVDMKIKTSKGVGKINITY
jgi:hypothetical protein